MGEEVFVYIILFVHYVKIVMVDQYVNTANLIQDVKNAAEHLYVKVNGVKLDHTTHITKVIVCRVL